jgi:hypothetical protein
MADTPFPCLQQRSHLFAKRAATIQFCLSVDRPSLCDRRKHRQKRHRQKQSHHFSLTTVLAKKAIRIIVLHAKFTGTRSTVPSRYVEWSIIPLHRYHKKLGGQLLAMGHSRRFEDAPITSGRAPSTDIGDAGRHVSDLPTADEAQNWNRRLFRQISIGGSPRASFGGREVLYGRARRAARHAQGRFGFALIHHSNLISHFSIAGWIASFCAFGTASINSASALLKPAAPADSPR